jgi:acetyl esterase/lipase
MTDQTTPPTTSIPQPPYPLHLSVKDRIHPEYAAFYNDQIINKQQVQYQPMEAIRAASGVLIPGGGPMLPVGKTEDILFKRQESTGPDVSVRVFTPEISNDQEIPEGGWPVYVYYHGGGWVLGNIDTENTVSTNVCKRAKVVVVSVNYRFGFPFLSSFQHSIQVNFES